MIPSFSVIPGLSLPEGDDCGYPARGGLSDEGFGYFVGTWRIGHPLVSMARESVGFERRLVDLLDSLATDSSAFERFATAAESFEPYGELDPVLTGSPVQTLLEGYDDGTPLGGLEIGVAGLVYALSAVGFLTAASCRAHVGPRSWSDCPVVFFGAHKWRAEILAKLALETGCGIGQDRDMLTVYAPTIRNLMTLAETVLDNRGRLRSRPKAMQSLWG